MALLVSRFGCGKFVPGLQVFKTNVSSITFRKSSKSSFIRFGRRPADCIVGRVRTVTMMPQKNTGAQLAKLRQLMKDEKYVPRKLAAYVVPSGDAHQSEYIASCDQRREYISGFSGSLGTAVITENVAALWTDSRYFLQAEQQLDSNWELVKEGLSTSPTMGAWLNSLLPAGSTVGVDPFLMSADAWNSLSNLLDYNGNTLVAVEKNLIDAVWDADRPTRPTNPAVPLALTYCGISWPEKISSVRDALKENDASVLVVTALDEIAWLLNLRGTDVDYNPVFFAYVIVTHDAVNLFIDPIKLGEDAKNHLQVAVGDHSPAVTLLPYDDVRRFLRSLVDETSGKIWISNTSSYGLVSLIPKTRLVFKTSPIQLLKAVKNDVEVQGMRSSSIRDAVALCEYFLWLEHEVPKGVVTEVSGAEKLLQFRREQALFVGPSFATISSSGSHGAVVHYQPSAETDRPINVDEMYLCDSGGQYLDGTTDVTRTFHFGTPSDYEVECFTRVIKGHIALGTTVFPRRIKGLLLDTLARTALWQAGLNYFHGTGHGVGSYLNVHEGPILIGPIQKTDDPGILENMIITNEPGYYEDGKFGCRLENVTIVVPAKTKFGSENSFLRMENLTFVPIQRKLINVALLTEKELDWIDAYHSRCRDVIGPVLREQGRSEALAWLTRETEPLSRDIRPDH